MAEDEGATRLGVPSFTEGVLLAPGATLVSGTYQIEKRLGAGGMGEVWRAHNTVTGAPCAIKVVRQELVVDDLAVALFKGEAEALKNIRDSAVVGYEGAFRDEHGRVFLVMQYVEGPSLAERMRKEPLTVEEVTKLMGRLARGLAAAHAAGVFHRDLSPDNVLLPGAKLEDAVIIDFGIAKRTGSTGPTLYGGATQGFTGKFSYASPEQAGAVDAPVDHRSDIYSLGLVLAAAARGRPLPMGSDPLSAVGARRKRPDLGSLPRPLQTLLAPLLAPDPRERPQSMQDVLKMAQLPPPQSATRWIAVAGAGAVGLAVAAALWVMLSEPAPPPTIPQLRSKAETTSEDLQPSVPSQPLATTPTQTPIVAEPPTVTAPAQPDLRDLEAALHALVAAQPCAEITTAASPDGVVRVSGQVGSVGTRERLLKEIGDVHGVTSIENALAVVPQPHCEAAAVIANTIGPSNDGNPRIELSEPSGVYSASRSVFQASVAAPPKFGGFLYVDYFDQTGQVYHLLPEELTPDNRIAAAGRVQIGKDDATAGPDDRVWHLSEPFGPGRIVAIVSESPLYEGLRPIGEPADQYLDFLRGALESARSFGRVAATDVAIETRP